MSARYEPVIGLEVHAQLLTRSKLFCPCSTAFGAPPNTHVCPVCLGLPGALPVLNREAVRLATRAALALGCTPRRVSRFARKNYFYPDLPKGYQISQFDEPLAENGAVDLEIPAANDDEAPLTRHARIQRVHMEEDAGKNVHNARNDSVVDLNRAGTPLVEIVGHPDLRSAAEAASYLRALKDVLVFTGVNDGNLEEGSFRCDANVSIRKVGEEKLGTRVELKNINSFKFVERAIAYEIERQESVIESGGRIVQETRGWEEKSGTTYSLRSKETAQDYRYFPDPDLPPLLVDEAFVSRVRAEMPELPRDKRERFVKEMHLSELAAGVLTQHPRVAAFFEETAMLHLDAVAVANFVQSEVLRDTTTHGLTAEIPIAPRQLAGILKLVEKRTISGKQAKDLYAKVKGTPRSAEDVASELGLSQIVDPAQIEAFCAKAIEQNPRQLASYRAGKEALFGFFVGQVMKETSGRASPQIVNDTLKRLLGAP